MVATILPPGMQQFADGNGKPYAAGFVEMYIPATLTLKTTWIDRAKLVINTNPIRLDANGRCVIFGAGIYRQILKDAFGVTIWDKLVESRDDELEAELSAIGIIAGGRLRQVLNVALMQALLKVDLVDGEQASIAGYTSEGDGGGGIFSWDANSVEGVDGGTIFDADEGGVGRWIRNERSPLNVSWWGVKGDGTLSSIPFQAAANVAAERSLFVPAGSYLIQDVTLPEKMRLYGERGTFIAGPPGQNIFLVDGDHREIDHIYFRGVGCAAIINPNLLTSRTGRSWIHHCEFDAELAECIVGCLIECTIVDNVFGYLGTNGLAHRHIASPKGSVRPNHNRVLRNFFWKAKGASNSSIYFDGGTNLLLEGNEWSGCLTDATLILQGMEVLRVKGNWFEGNTGTKELLVNDSATGTVTRTIEFEGNTLQPHANITEIFNITSAGSVASLSAKHNGGGGFAGQEITKYNGANDGGIVEWFDNNIQGYSRADYNITKRTATGVTAYGTVSTANVTGDGTVYKVTVFDQILNDNNIANFNTGTGTFTASEEGTHCFDVAVGIAQVAGGHTDGYIELVASGGTRRVIVNPATLANSGGIVSLRLNADMYMSVGETAFVNVMVGGGAKVVDIYSSLAQRTTYFSATKAMNG